MPAKKTTKKAVNTVIDVFGFKLDTSEDKIYEVTSKYDGDAPDGFKEHRTTKILNDSAGVNTIGAVYNENFSVWDTGLFEESPMYRDLSLDDRKAKVAQIKELIVEPFEKMHGTEKLNPRDIESKFWNRVNNTSFKIELYKGKIFNTKHPDQLLQLFIALSYKALAPKDKEDLPDYRQAQFCIENRDAVKTMQQEKEDLELRTKGEFYKLLEDPTKLKFVLNYVGLKGLDTTEEVNKGVVTGQFNRFVDNKQNGYENKKTFLETLDLAKEPEGYKEIGYYKSLQELAIRRVVQKDTITKKFVLGDVELGGTLKEAAHNIVKKKSLENAITEVL